jgi:hypothetical protein
MKPGDRVWANFHRPDLSIYGWHEAVIVRRYKTFAVYRYGSNA